MAVEQGKDPLAERRAKLDADTFQELSKLYIAEHRVRRSRAGRESVTTKEAQRILDADILPLIGAYKSAEIKRYHETNVVETVAARGAYVAADRTLGVIRAIYRWANATGRLELDPTLGLAKRNAGKAQSRVLSDEEIRTLWERLDRPSPMSDELRAAFKLQLLLGLRIGEVIGAEQSDINLDAKTWTVPAERTKSNRMHCLPLPGMALEILKSVAKGAGKSRWLFPSSEVEGTVRTKSAARAMARLRAELGIKDHGHP